MQSVTMMSYTAENAQPPPRRSIEMGVTLNIHKPRWVDCLLLIAAVMAPLSGCAVPQRPGNGLCMHRVEPNTRTGYWLYLPEDYVAQDGELPKGQRWPLVVTFHGMNPYDTANDQIREWQEEADRYGLIVLAPELRTCNSFMQYPLVDPSLPYVRQDDHAVMVIMDEVFRLTNADPTHVLSTSFSCGGYLAHYLINHHPERFSCLAVRGSNFSRAMLSATQIPKYRDAQIGIFFGENDFKVCRDESLEAIEWYRNHRFNVEARKVGGLGHERKPQLAAALFARTVGLTPKTPPELGQLVMMDIPANDYPPIRRRSIPPLSPSGNRRRTYPSPFTSTSKLPERLTQETHSNRREILFNRNRSKTTTPIRQQPSRTVAPSGSRYRPVSPIENASQRSATPKRPIRQPYSTGRLPAPRTEKRDLTPTVPVREQAEYTPIPARIQIQGDAAGRSPLWVTMRVQIPPDLREGASVLWTDNSMPIGNNGFELQTVLREPGEHQITSHVFTDDNRSATARQTVTVFGPTSRPSGS